MNTTNDSHRVVVAVSENSPVLELWRAAMQVLGGSQTELIILFVDDERWRRAASLPFTREISRIGGSVVDFTAQRAEQVYSDAVNRTQRQLKQLARDADLDFAFNILAESDQQQIHELTVSAQDVLIAPSFLATRPVCAHLAKLECTVLLIDATEANRSND